MEGRKKRKNIHIIMEDFVNKLEHILKDVNYNKRIACVSETKYIISLILQIIPKLCEQVKVNDLEQQLQQQVIGLTNVNKLQSLLHFWFSNFVACICSGNLNTLPKNTIHYIIVAIMEAYPALQERVIEVKKEKDFQYNCNIIQDFFMRHHNIEPELCPELMQLKESNF